MSSSVFNSNPPNLSKTNLLAPVERHDGRKQQMSPWEQRKIARERGARENSAEATALDASVAALHAEVHGLEVELEASAEERAAAESASVAAAVRVQRAFMFFPIFCVWPGGSGLW